MTEQVQLAIIGAGPAGLAAATEAARCGLEVALIDEQQAVGGQIYRGITRSNPALEKVLGPDYSRGKSLAEVLASGSVRHIAGATVWQVTSEREIYFSKDGVSRLLRAEQLILATGAMERPMPFPGWTLPGVMTAGAGQILLKTAGLMPRGDLVLAGSGPLLFLLAAQYLRAGGKVGAIVETTPRANYLRALAHFPGAIRANSYLRKGLGLLREIGKYKVPHYKGATQLEASGGDAMQVLRFSRGERSYEIPCSTLLLHIGVVPSVQITRALDLEHDWDELQRCWRPRLGEYGETQIEGLTVAGDGGGIGGAEAAEHQGRIAALHAAKTFGAIDADAFKTGIEAERRKLDYHKAARPFIDGLYAPSPEFLSPPDATIVCRCEEVTAGQIREFVKLGCLGPNQTKSFGRSGMGPCQGRFCGLPVSEIIADARGKPVQDIGYYRIRPPIKPVTLGELASLHEDDDEAGASKTAV